MNANMNDTNTFYTKCDYYLLPFCTTYIPLIIRDKFYNVLTVLNIPCLADIKIMQFIKFKKGVTSYGFIYTASVLRRYRNAEMHIRHQILLVKQYLCAKMFAITRHL